MSKESTLFPLLESLKDHDTYAVLNYLLVAGLHHFYLGKFLEAINLIILASGIGLIIFTQYVFVGTLLIIFILIVELLALLGHKSLS